jgi:hypothetical protein
MHRERKKRLTLLARLNVAPEAQRWVHDCFAGMSVRSGTLKVVESDRGNLQGGRLALPVSLTATSLTH